MLLQRLIPLTADWWELYSLSCSLLLITGGTFMILLHKRKILK